MPKPLRRISSKPSEQFGRVALTSTNGVSAGYVKAILIGPFAIHPWYEFHPERIETASITVVTHRMTGLLAAKFTGPDREDQARKIIALYRELGDERWNAIRREPGGRFVPKNPVFQVAVEVRRKAEAGLWDAATKLVTNFLLYG